MSCGVSFFSIKVVGEMLDWQGHDPEDLKRMKDYLTSLKAQGIEAINE
jgi:rifampin ADP-ribosylating transferase